MNTTNTISNDDNLVDQQIDVKSVLDNNKDIMKPFSSERMNELRRELGVKNQIKSMEKFIKGGCGKKKMVKLQKRVTELDGRLKKMMSVESTTLDAVLGDAMTMSPEHQEEGYNALIGMLRAGSTAGREETWERVLLAERFRNVLLAQRISLLNCQNIIDAKKKLDVDILAQRFEDITNTQNSQIKSIENTENTDIENLKINIDEEVESKVEINDVMVIENIVNDYDDNSNHNDVEKDIEKRRRIEIDLDVYVIEINSNFSKTNQTSELIKWKQKNENISDNLVDINPSLSVDSDLDVGSDEETYVTPYIFLW